MAGALQRADDGHGLEQGQMRRGPTVGDEAA
jgi:hypothetical protein